MRRTQVEDCVDALERNFPYFPRPAPFLQIPRARIFYDAIATNQMEKYWFEYLLERNKGLTDGPSFEIKIYKRGRKYIVYPFLISPGNANIDKINIIPISIRGIEETFTTSHRMVAIAFPKYKTIELFEPYGTDKKTLPWQETVENKVILLLKEYYPGYKIKRALSICPRFSWQSKLDNTKGLCVAWSFLYVYLRTTCSDIPPTVLIKELLNIDDKKVLALLFHIMMGVWNTMSPSLASMMKTYLLLVGIDFVEDKNNKIGFYNEKRTKNSVMTDEKRRVVSRDFTNNLTVSPKNQQERNQWIDNYRKDIINKLEVIYGGNPWVREYFSSLSQ